MTGVIYAAIVVAWAAYLVPLALRRHDEASRKRSVDRFSSRMRVLARRDGGAPIKVQPARPDAPQMQPTRTEAETVVERPRVNRRAAAAAARRRRRVLYALLGLTVVVVGASAFSLLPWWSFVLPLALVGGFLALARTQVRRQRAATWSQTRVVETKPRNVVPRAKAARVEASHGAQTDRQSLVADDDADEAETVVLTAEQLDAARVVAVDGGSLWDPLPVTLPTYVDKPVAASSTRSVDLGSAATWSSGHDAADSALVAEADALADDAPRVVNG